MNPENEDEFEIEVDGTEYRVEEYCVDGFTTFSVERKEDSQFCLEIVESNATWRINTVYSEQRTCGTIKEAWTYARDNLL